MTRHEQRKRYFVSAAHGVVQDIRNETGEFEVYLDEEELTLLTDLLQSLEQEDDTTFRRAFVPYKSADHDAAAQAFDDKIISLYQYLYDHGSPATRQVIADLHVLSKLENSAYHDKGYDTEAP